MTLVNRASIYNDSFPVGWVPQPLILSKEEIAKMPRAKRDQVGSLIEQFKKSVAINPLWDTYLRDESHHKFAGSRAMIAIALAGNRWGKTSTMAIMAIINCLPMDWVPPHLLQYRRYLDETPFYCRIVCPTLKDHALDIVLPLLKRWCPRGPLLGGSFDKAWSKTNYVLTFKNGSTIEFRSYDQDAEHHAGASRHGIFLDEPPPRDIFMESVARVAEYEGGFIRIGATMAKGVPPWFRKELYVRSKVDPNIEVFFGSIHDNDTLSESNKAVALSMYSEKERKVREFGRLLSLEGAVYDAYDFEAHGVDDIIPAALKDHAGQIYIAIDPGLRAPAAVFAIANSLTEEIFFFDEVCPRMNTMSVRIFVDQIRQRMEYWGLTDNHVNFVIDPQAARTRSMDSGETLITEYNRFDIYPEPGNNDRYIGIPRMNDLFIANKIYIAKRCTTLSDQLESWSWSQTMEDAKGDPKPEEGDNDATDAARYLVMAIPWTENYSVKPAAPIEGTLEEFLQYGNPNRTRLNREASWAF